MPERWEHELDKLRAVKAPARLRARVEEGPRGDGVPPAPGRQERLVAAAVAIVVFVAAGAFALRAFVGDEPGSPVTPAPASGAPAVSSEPTVPSIPTIAMPDLIGLGDQPALQQLFDLDLRPNVKFREVAGVEQWRVASQEPPPGTEVTPETRVEIVIATEITPLPAGAVDALSCPDDEREPFGGPHVRMLPGGSAYITGNLGGLREGDRVVQVTFGDQEWSGIWHWVRDGNVIAVVEFDSLDGVACVGSGVAGA